MSLSPSRCFGLLLVLSALASCARAPAPTCNSTGDCNGFDGKRVAVIGVYRALPHPKGAVRGETEALLARVDLDREGPYLEPFWNPRAQRSAEELRRLDGKRVRVVGTYHREQPRNPRDPPYAEAMGGPCVAEIEELAVADP